MKVKLIWYDLEGEKGTDIINDAIDIDDAIKKGYEKHGGNPPAKLVSTIEIK